MCSGIKSMCLWHRTKSFTKNDIVPPSTAPQDFHPLGPHLMDICKIWKKTRKSIGFGPDKRRKPVKSGYRKQSTIPDRSALPDPMHKWQRNPTNGHLHRNRRPNWAWNTSHARWPDGPSVHTRHNGDPGHTTPRPC